MAKAQRSVSSLVSELLALPGVQKVTVTMTSGYIKAEALPYSGPKIVPSVSEMTSQSDEEALVSDEEKGAKGKASPREARPAGAQEAPKQ